MKKQRESTEILDWEELEKAPNTHGSFSFLRPQLVTRQEHRQAATEDTPVQRGNSLSYAMGNLDSQFTSKFASVGYAPTTNYASRYAEWSNTSMDSTRSALEAAGVQSDQLSTEQDLLEQLQSMSAGTDGQLKAIQTGNQVAAMEVQQLMKLRQLMMADMQSKAAFQAQQIAQTDEQQRALGFFKGPKLYDPY